MCGGGGGEGVDIIEHCEGGRGVGGHLGAGGGGPRSLIVLYQGLSGDQQSHRAGVG